MANGFFLGGAAEGISSGMQLGLAAQEQKLKQKQIDLQNEQFTKKNQQTVFNNYMKSVQETVKGLKGKTQEEIDAAKLKLMETVRPVGQFIGKGAYDTQYIDQAINSLMGVVTNDESSLNAAKAEKQKRLAIEEANKITSPTELQRKIEEKKQLSAIPATTNNIMNVYNKKTNTLSTVNVQTNADGTYTIKDQNGQIKLLNQDEQLVKPPTVQSQSLQGIDISTKTKSDLEKTIQQQTESLASFNEIINSFDPKFLTTLEQWKVGAFNQMERWSMRLKPDQQKEVRKFAKLERNTYAALNTLIHNLSGAATTEQEAKRLKKQMPDLDKDGPTKFMQHAKDAAKEAQAIIDRAKYYKDKGMPVDFKAEGASPMSLTYFKQRREEIQRRGQELYQSGHTTSEIRDILRKEFDIGS